MTRCLDEAKLQSYFDGELSISAMESVTSHLASCVTCAAAARELEEARCARRADPDRLRVGFSETRTVGPGR